MGLRVILDTFGVESSKLVRRGEDIELDLKAINDDYILDSPWNYCAQMQFNITSTLQQQQMQQHAQQQQVNSIYQPMQSMAYGQQQQQQNYQQHGVYQQVQLQQVQQPASQMTDAPQIQSPTLMSQDEDYVYNIAAQQTVYQLNSYLIHLIFKSSEST